MTETLITNKLAARIQRSHYATKETGECVTSASEHADCCDTLVVCGWVLLPTTLDQDGERVMHRYCDWAVYAALELQGISANM